MKPIEMNVITVITHTTQSAGSSTDGSDIVFH